MTPHMRIVPHYRAMCPEPGPHDMFIVTFINGKRKWVNPVGDYPRIKAWAERVARELREHVKVIPIAPEEVMGFLNLQPASVAPDQSAATVLDIKACIEVLLKCGSGNDIEDALRRLVAPDTTNLLSHLGVLQ